MSWEVTVMVVVQVWGGGVRLMMGAMLGDKQ